MDRRNRIVNLLINKIPFDLLRDVVAELERFDKEAKAEAIELMGEVIDSPAGIVRFGVK